MAGFIRAFPPRLLFPRPVITEIASQPFAETTKKNYLYLPHPIPKRNLSETRHDLDGDLMIKAICAWQIISNQRFVNEKLVSSKPLSAYIQLYAPYTFIHA